MPNDPTSELQDEFLTAIRKSQDTVIDAIKSWVDTVQSAVPPVPAIQLPAGVQAPKPEEVVASAYNFAEQLLASQRRFAEELLKTTSPLLPGADTKPTATAAK
jgi:hypothetical protein